ncbi:MAG: hypothetical protein PVI23_04995 [Maricaulaceae bacterium]|jgi:uncharacterized membrane protein
MTTLLILLATAAAVGALIGFNALLGGWRPARIASLEEAGARLKLDRIDFVPGDGALAADGRAALIADAASDRIGMVLARGDTTLTRLLTPAEVKSARATEDGGLELTLDDFTLPKAVLSLNNPDAARDWAARLTGAEPDDEQQDHG